MVSSRANLIETPRLRHEVRAAYAVENVLPGMTTNGHARFWRIGGALLLAFLLAVLLAARADAAPRLKTSCTIYDTNRVDPIAFSAHLHRHFGNTSTTNSSTGATLFNRRTTSCRDKWFTSAGCSRWSGGSLFRG
jgi:hypothetical protein